MMGVSRAGKKYPRVKRDHYPTHESVTDALLQSMVFGETVCDPCCGPDRLILKSAERHGHRVVGSDIIYGFDFLKSKLPKGWGTFDIISNPPYGDRQARMALWFIERALEITHEWNGKVAMLLPSDFDCGYSRRHVFETHSAFDATIVLQNRVRIFDERSGTSNHSWFVWDWKRKDGPSRKLYSHISYGE